MTPSFDIEIALPPSTPFEVPGLVKPRIRLDLVPLTKDNPLWMEAGFLAYLERKPAAAGEEPPAPDARTDAKEAAKGIADAGVIGWAFWDATLDAWAIRDYTPDAGLAFLSQLIDARGGLGIFAEIQRAVFELSKLEAPAADAESAAGNSSSG